jgi:hypothetical protein
MAAGLVGEGPGHAAPLVVLPEIDDLRPTPGAAQGAPHPKATGTPLTVGPVETGRHMLKVFFATIADYVDDFMKIYPVVHDNSL